MNDIIITGASKGIGKALYNELKNNKNNRLYLVARNFEISEFMNANIFKYDLSDVNYIDSLVEQIFNKIDLSNSERIVLINNAGILSPIKFSGNDEPYEIINNLSVNLMAPVLLTSGFIKKLKNFKGEKKVINISSGAGKAPYAGWSLYTTAKAGIDMFTRSIALEQSMVENGVKVVSFAPGIVETDMQKQIRNTNKEDFPLVDKFLQIKEQNLAFSPEIPAKAISELIFNEFKSGELLDIRFH